MAKLKYSNRPPKNCSQKPSAPKRGSAVSFAPIISGIRYTPVPVRMGMATRKIMVVPCMVNIWL